MPEIAQKHRDQLARIKKMIRTAHDAFKNNYDSFNEMRRFIFDTQLRDADITLLMDLSKPQLEFNVLEAYISRLLGEFSKQEPSIEVSSDDEQKADPNTIEFLEGHLRHELLDSKNHHTAYEVYKDLLSGGFSVFKITTDYVNEMSFDQGICFDRAFDPTLCVFDQMAKYSHKGDGRFCCEIIPMSKEEFEQMYPDVDLSTINFNRFFQGFHWAYLDDQTQIILVADFYEKKKKKERIVRLSDNQVIKLKDYESGNFRYDKFLAKPSIVGAPRTTEIETIVRYRLVENQILEYVETDYRYLPLVFVDGNSCFIRTPKNANIRQVCNAYVKNAMGAQKLKNFAGITLANELENIVQHKFKVAKESLPKEEDWLRSYRNIQQASTLVYNAFDEKDPTKALPPPQEISRVPPPPELMQGFMAADSLIQNILGSYDSSLGINNNQLSGVAVVESATQSNASAMPYIVGYLQGLQRVSQIFLDLIPKYYTTPRTVPVRGLDGKRTYMPINQQGAVSAYYDSNIFNVKVEAGVNFGVQKSKALTQIVALMQASQQFSQFMNEAGLPILLDNIEIKGVDQIKILAEQWMQKQQMMQQQAMQAQQQAMQNNPQMINAQANVQKVKLEEKKNENEFMLELEKLRQSEEIALRKAKVEEDDHQVERLKAHAEIFSKEIQNTISEREDKRSHTDMLHRHLTDHIKLSHEKNKEH